LENDVSHSANSLIPIQHLILKVNHQAIKKRAISVWESSTRIAENNTNNQQLYLTQQVLLPVARQGVLRHTPAQEQPTVQYQSHNQIASSSSTQATIAVHSTTISTLVNVRESTNIDVDNMDVEVAVKVILPPK
jgi:hypothetical protein